MPRAVLSTCLLACLLMAGCASGWRAAPEADVVNSLGMRFRKVPAGEFLMGSDETPAALAAAYPGLENQRFLDLVDEAPVHRVRITRPFYMGQFEVTVGQFRRFLEASGYQPESVADGTGGYGYNATYDADKSASGDAFEGRDPRYTWHNPGFAQTDTHPVVNVTWNDAVAMAAWLGRTEGRRYRLPTEAEWEYAARAGTRTRYQNGDDPLALAEVANSFDTAAAPYWPRFASHASPPNDGFAFTAPVGSFRPNAFGLYDMHGNAWEWVSDWYGEDYYARSPVDDPQGPADANVHVRRGGSWHTWPLYLRSSYRNWNTATTRYPLVGMRLVLEADAPGTAPATRAPAP